MSNTLRFLAIELAAVDGGSALVAAPSVASAQVLFGGYGYRGFYGPGYPFFGYYPVPFPRYAAGTASTAGPPHTGAASRNAAG